MKSFLSFFSFALTICTLHGQANIQGQIMDNNGQALEFANVLLYQSTDSSLHKGQLSDLDGRFLFEAIPTGDYYLEVKMLGYNTFSLNNITVAEASQDIELPTITLQEAAAILDAVTVTASKPFLEQRAGKLIVNADAQITGQSGSLMDLLRKVPGLVVVNDRIRMAGRPNVTILIDGRPTQYMDINALLREMPADNIARIEVISQPDASFDASGTGGVINIVLKKNIKLGTNGSVRLGVGYGELAKYRTNIRLNYRNNKWNLFGAVGHSHRSFVERMELDRKVLDRTFLQETYEPSTPYGYSTQLGADYYLDDRQTIGIATRGNFSRNNRTHENNSQIIDSETGNVNQDFRTNNQLKRDWWYGSTDLHYTFDIDTSGQQLSLSGNYSRYNRNSSSYVTSTLISGEPIQLDDTRNEIPSDVDILAFQGDYKYPLGKKASLQIGGKISNARIDGDLQAWTLSEGDWKTDENFSNHFILDEDIYATYVNANFSIQNIEFAAGLRYEYTRSEGTSLTLDTTSLRRYDQLFPSLSINIPINQTFGLALAYSYRINRPSYSNLNPFVYIIDPFTYQQGNPQLRPELTHSTKLSITYNKTPFFNLEYNRTNDVMQLVTEQSDVSGIAFGRTVNLDAFEQIGGSLFAPLNFAKPLSGYAGVMLYYNRYSSAYLGDQFEADQLSFTGFMQLTANWGKDWSSELSGFFVGRGVDGIMRHQPFYGMSLGVQKRFWNDNATLALSFDDFIFRNWRGEINYQNMDMDIISSWETRIVNLNFTYKFGNQHLKARKDRRSSSSEEKQRAQAEN